MAPNALADFSLEGKSVVVVGSTYGIGAQADMSELLPEFFAQQQANQ